MKLTCFLLALVVVSTLEARPAGRFVVISDIHFNPLADPALAPKLLSTGPGEWEALFQDDAHAAPQAYNEDSAWVLFHSLVSELRALEPRPKLVIVTGDILAHHLQEKFAAAAQTKNPAAYRLFIKNTVAFIGQELEKASGAVPVVYTTGNNDDECGDYALQPGGPFLEDTAATVAGMAHMSPEKLTSWATLGSYVTDNPLAGHHRIIALNTGFWSRRYSNSCAQDAAATDPGAAVLTWLRNELAEARRHGQKVWLTYHIPPGMDGHTSSRTHQVTPMWKPNYADGFNKLLDEYAKTIELNLAGHTHLDDFRLVRTAHANTLVLLTPGVSPNVGQNPAFRVITVDSHARPQDLFVYYMPNLEAPKWQLEYSAREALDLKRIDAPSYAALYGQIEQSKTIGDKWRLYYSVSRPESLSNAEGYLRSLYCATGHTEADDFKACINSPADANIQPRPRPAGSKSQTDTSGHPPATD